jgi:transposase
MLGIAASTLHRSHAALGAVLRRLKSMLGAPKAITAAAYEITHLKYSMMIHWQDSVEAGQGYYEQRYKARIIKNMQ